MEFGHEAINLGGFHVDAWGAGPFLIRIAGREYLFEDSDRFGPQLITKKGDLRKNPVPHEKSIFWRAYELWRDQGRRLAEDGVTCIWD
jgi:hypothetical protein